MSRRVIGAAIGVSVLVAACTEGAGSNEDGLRSESAVSSATTFPGATTAPATTSLGGSSTSTSTSTSTTVVADPPAGNLPFLSMSVPRSRYESITAVEADIGQRLDMIRWFQRWDDDLTLPDMVRAMAEGRRVHLSVRPAGGDGLVVPWRDLAEAQPGSEVYDQLVAWVDRMAALPTGSYVTLNHEPETRESAANGSAADFRAMWVRWNELLDERGGDHLETVWVMTGGAFGSDVADEWYPGDDSVDIVGVDPYNWFTCQGTDRPWVKFADLVAAPLEFASVHAKPLAVAETASVEDPGQPGRKGDWIREAAAYLDDPAVASRFEYVSWFNVTSPGGTYPDCVWDYDTSPESAAAFRELVRTLGDG